MLNINLGYNRELMEQCRSLWDKDVLALRPDWVSILAGAMPTNFPGTGYIRTLRVIC